MTKKENENSVSSEVEGFTVVTSGDSSSWTADVYQNVNDLKPSAKVEVSSLESLFERASALE